MKSKPGRPPLAKGESFSLYPPAPKPRAPKRITMRRIEPGDSSDYEAVWGWIQVDCGRRVSPAPRMDTATPYRRRNSPEWNDGTNHITTRDLKPTPEERRAK